MKTAKDLIIPFSWHERRPLLLDRFFYVPAQYAYSQTRIPFFEKEQPLYIEYCSGNGQWIGERAKQNPDTNWIAVEKKFERARQIWLKSHRENLPNLCVVCADALTFTRYYAPKAEEAFVNFPDPWPKRRHAKHRLIRPEFLKDLSQILDPGCKATCVTDDAVYAEQILKVFQMPEWKLLFHVTDLPDYGKSFFKDLWLNAGRTIYYVSFGRV